MYQSSDREANKEIKRAKTTNGKDKFQETLFSTSSTFSLGFSPPPPTFVSCHLYSNMVLLLFFFSLYFSVALVANRRRKRKVFTFWFLVIVNVEPLSAFFYPWRRKYCLSYFVTNFLLSSPPKTVAQQEIFHSLWAIANFITIETNISQIER